MEREVENGVDEYMKMLVRVMYNLYPRMGVGLAWGAVTGTAHNGREQCLKSEVKQPG